MKKPEISDEAVKRGTGKSWEEWFHELKVSRSADHSHKEIARKISKEYEVSAWWAQMITVEFERSIGRRQIGQTCEGVYQASASRTLSCNIDQALEKWQFLVQNLKEFNNCPFSSDPSTSKTEKWRYWKINLKNGSKITIIFGDKKNGKTSISVNHEKLSSSEESENWKAYWKMFLMKMINKETGV